MKREAEMISHNAIDSIADLFEAGHVKCIAKLSQHSIRRNDRHKAVLYVSFWNTYLPYDFHMSSVVEFRQRVPQHDRMKRKLSIESLAEAVIRCLCDAVAVP